MLGKIYVGEGYRTSTPARVTNSSVVRRDSVDILLLIVALNEVDVLRADIKNIFGKVWCVRKDPVSSKNTL